MALKNKLINHIDKIKEIVLENELLKYAVKSLQKKLEEKNHNIQQLKVNSNTHHPKRLVNQHNNDNLNFKQKKIVHFNTAPHQQFQRRNIRNFVRNVQTSLEAQRQPPKQSHPKIFIILKRKKFI
jgi:predicted nuclease with TOPRIM domain